MAIDENEFNKLKERVEMLFQVVINKDKLISLALQNGWNYEQVEQIYKIMEKFANQKQKDYNFHNIDTCFHKVGISYQDVKSILRVFYESRSFLQVIKRYLESNFEHNQQFLSSEFNEMFAELDNKPNI